MCVDGNNNIYVTGVFSSSVLAFENVSLNNSGGSSGSTDMFIVKYDQAGNVGWAQRAGSNQSVYAHEVSCSSAGDLYFSGTSGSTFTMGALSFSAGSSGLAVFGKLSSAGVPLALDFIQKSTLPSLGNGRTMIGYDETGGEFYLAGAVYDNAVFGTSTVSNGGMYVARTGQTVSGLTDRRPDDSAVYPVPCRDIVYIKHLSTERTSFKIRSVIGKTVLSGETTKGISIATLPAGIYYLTLTGDNHCYRFVKE
jgi:hypothetical protein